VRGGKIWDKSRAQKFREQRNGSETCWLGAHDGRGIEMFRSGRRNSARKAECGLPSRAKKGRRRTRAPASRARSGSTRPAQGSTVDFERKKEPESQGQAGTPEKRAQRNRPCHNGNRHEPRAQHGPPVPGRGGWASKPATRCKQWPASFSRFEYHPTGRTKLNHFWLMPVNFWLSRRPRGFS
jgi:hypothetical protein